MTGPETSRSDLRVAVVGCGLIGRRRAAIVAREDGARVVDVVDVDRAAAEALAAELGCAAGTVWATAVTDPRVDAVIVATPHDLHRPVTVAALAAGKHVLIEKPMGRNLKDTAAIAAAARGAAGVLRAGFNHRYHPGIARAHEVVASGALGAPINLRARYGHGGRAGYEGEWRASAGRAGGGELTDQGAHLADLVHWFLGEPVEAFAYLQTAVWPIAPVEDNAFGLYRFPSGVVASVHASWTQWRNLFSLEVFCERGAAIVEGLGGSYGVEQLTVQRRHTEGGAPDAQVERFEAPDGSWTLEWRAFLDAVRRCDRGDAGEEALVAMRMVDALYRSAAGGQPVALDALNAD